MAELGMGMERSCCVSAPDILGAQMDTHRRKSWNGEAEGVQRCCGFGIVAQHTPSFQAAPAAARLAPSWRLPGTATLLGLPARLDASGKMSNS